MPELNPQTIVVGILLLAAVLLACRSILKSRKKGGCSGCSGGCGGACGHCSDDCRH